MQNTKNAATNQSMRITDKYTLSDNTEEVKLNPAHASQQMKGTDLTSSCCYTPNTS